MAIDRREQVRGRRRFAAVLALVATLGYAAAASAAEVRTVPATVAVALPGAAVAWMTLRSPSRSVTAVEPLRRATMLWVSLALAGLLWEAGAWIGEHTRGEHEHPTLSALAAPLLNEPGVRFAAWSLWLLAGWRLIRR